MELNLDNVQEFEPFVLIFKGETHSYDLLELIFKMRQYAEQMDALMAEPSKFKKVISELFDLELNATQALVIFRTLSEEGEQQFDELLKNVTGRSLSSTTTLDSDSENLNSSEISNE